jgi:ABC-type transport system substrate-binding protein
MEIDLTYWEANWGGVDNQELMGIIHSNLEEIGIRGRIRKYQGGEYFELPLERLRGVTMSMSGCIIPDPDDLMRRRMTWINVSGHDFKVESEFVAALHETDARKRSERYRKLQEKFLREGPMIYLLTFPSNVAYNRQLRGYIHPPHWGGPDFSRLYFVRSPGKASGYLQSSYR